MKYLNRVLDYIENRMLKITVLVTFFFSIFVSKKFWIDLINAIWVDPFMSKLYGYEIWIAIQYGLIISLYYYYKLKKTEHYNEKRAYCIGFFILIYILGLISKEWTFSLITIKTISLAWTNLIFLIIPSEIYLFYTCKKRKNEPSTPLLEIEKTSDTGDSYNRKGYCESVYNAIETCFFEEQSFAVGISGSWGSGKTTFMNALKGYFKDSKGNKSIIRFEPWKNEAPSLIIKSFFDLLKKELKPHISNISIPIDKYVVSLLDSNASIKTKLLLNTIHFISIANQESPYEQIKKYLKTTKHRTLVFIDDIDRLDKNEIKEVLRLIRNTANFPYIQFIVAYDKDYLVSTLKDSGINSPTRYLEKFFNLEIPLPKYESRIICEELKNRLSKGINEVWSNSQNDDRIDSMIYHYTVENRINEIYKYWVPCVLTNIRDVIRFCNSFYISINTLKKLEIEKEIEFEDLFYLELLRYRYTDIYMFLRNKPLSIIKLDKEATYNYVKESLDIVIKNYSYEAYDKKIITDIFGDLFKASNKKHPLCKTRYYLNYFMLRSDDKIFTEMEFLSLIGLDESELLHRAEKMYKEKYKFEFKIEISEILRESYVQESLNYHEIYKTLESLLKSDLLKEEVTNSILPYFKSLDRYDAKHLKAILDLYNCLDLSKDIQNLATANLLLDILIKENLSKKLNYSVTGEVQNIIQNFLKSFKDTKNMSLVISGFIDKVKREYKSDDELVIDVPTLSEIKLDYFINCPNKLSETGFTLFYNCIDYTNEDSQKVLLMDIALGLMRINIDKEPNLYYCNFIKDISSSPYDNTVSSDLFYNQIFGSNDEFGIFLYLHKSSSHYYERVRNYWLIYKNNGYKTLIFDDQGNVDDIIKNNFRKEVKQLNELKKIHKTLLENGGVMTKEMTKIYKSNKLNIKLRTEIEGLIKEK